MHGDKARGSSSCVDNIPASLKPCDNSRESCACSNRPPAHPVQTLLQGCHCTLEIEVKALGLPPSQPLSVTEPWSLKEWIHRGTWACLGSSEVYGRYFFLSLQVDGSWTYSKEDFDDYVLVFINSTSSPFPLRSWYLQSLCHSCSEKRWNLLAGAVLGTRGCAGGRAASTPHVPALLVILSSWCLGYSLLISEHCWAMWGFPSRA